MATTPSKTEKTSAKKTEKTNPNLYQAEYLGSGTFIISKPKRKAHKRRQSALKGLSRGARKA